MYRCKCPWTGTRLNYVGFDVTGDNFKQMVFGQGVCPNCNQPFDGCVHPDIHEWLELGVLDGREYTMRSRFTIPHMLACGIDRDDIIDLVTTIQQNLPLTAFHLQHRVASLALQAKQAYALLQISEAYQCVIDAFWVFERDRPEEVRNLMRGFALSTRIGVQRLINLPPAPSSVLMFQPDFGRAHVARRSELRPRLVLGLISLNPKERVLIKLTSYPYIELGEWKIKFRFVESQYAVLGEQSRFLSELGVTDYQNGAWSKCRHLIRVPENRRFKITPTGRCRY